MNTLGYIPYNQSLLDYARQNRKQPTRQEGLFWNLVLKNKRFMGYKFTRQKPIGPFILDFYCAKLLLGIEIDGEYHDENQGYDRHRDSEIKHYGIQIIRFKNKDIEKDLDAVVGKLSNKIKNIEKKMSFDVFD